MEKFGLFCEEGAVTGPHQRLSGFRGSGAIEYGSTTGVEFHTGTAATFRHFPLPFVISTPAKDNMQVASAQKL
jgi:hypothetical protein